MASPKCTVQQSVGMKFYEDIIIDGKKWFLPTTFPQHSEALRNFQAKPDDVWIMTQPRSGTTLTQEMVWLLSNNMDFETAKKFHLIDRSPEIPASLFPDLWEHCNLLRPSPNDPEVLEAVPVDRSKHSYEVYADLMSPRILKTHLAFSVHKNLLNSGCKVVYVARNPKDNLVSRVRFSTTGTHAPYKDGMQRCIEDFIATDGLIYGSYWNHIKEAWAVRDHPNVLFLFYEDLRTDLPGSIRKVAKFLGKSYSEEQYDQLAAHLHIDAFRKNPSVNELPGFKKLVGPFINGGRVGGWHEIITPELEVKIDQWIEENIKGTDIAFPILYK